MVAQLESAQPPGPPGRAVAGVRPDGAAAEKPRGTAAAVGPQSDRRRPPGRPTFGSEERGGVRDGWGSILKRVALLLAGGAGTRLRPLSSDDNPKQFLRIFDGRS